MPERIYADNASTTRVDPRVVEAMFPFLSECFGNASSVHIFGQEARAAVDLARSEVARLIGCAPNELLFTSGGTESNNLALRGLAEANASHGRHIVTGNTEHPAVRDVCRDLESKGFKVTEVACGDDGIVSSADILSAVREDTILITLMLANNETGVLQPVREIGDALVTMRESGRHIFLHTDAVQAVGKVEVSVDELGCDLLSLSGHKVYAPKGVGALYVRKGVRISRQNIGGGQERKLRGGTENVPGIVALGGTLPAPLVVGLGEACRIAREEMSVEASRVTDLRDILERGVCENISDITFNGSRERRIPNISNISFGGAEGEAVLINLDLRGVAVSTGSACSSGTIEPSPVILALPDGERRARGAVRFSFGRFNSEEEIRELTARLSEAVTSIRSLS